jgi:hypothetical protein
VLDLGDWRQPIHKRADAVAAEVTIGADGFSCTRVGEGRPQAYQALACARPCPSGLNRAPLSS